MQQSQMPHEIQKLVTRGEELYGNEVFGSIYTQFQALRPFLTDPGSSLEELVMLPEQLLIGNVAAAVEANRLAFLQYLKTPERLRPMQVDKQSMRAVGRTLAQLLAERVSLVQQISQSQPVSIGPNDLAYHVIQALEIHNLVKLDRDSWPPPPENLGRRVYTGQPVLGPRHGYDPITRPPT